MASARSCVMLVRGWAVLLLVLGFGGWAQAAEPIGPDPALSPEEVVRIQLSALQRNDFPDTNNGIRQTWALAHPDNRRLTGPLPRFEQMIRSEAYRPLIDHRAHEVEALGNTAEQAVFKVTVQTADGEVLEYLWSVGKVLEGPEAGAWMTTAVPAPRVVGQGI